MNTVKRVGIVICNYNKAEMVKTCISHVLGQTYKDYDLYVVDNGSADESVKVIEDNYKDRLTLIKNSENLGGSGGFNTGLRYAFSKGYEYLLCVDNDAMLDKNALEELVKFLDSHSECGIAASKIYHLEQPDIIQNFGQIIDYESFATRACYYGCQDTQDMPEVMFVDAVPACALLIRRSVIEKIGFLPEENFLYWDDTQWCIECGKAGYTVASVGSSKARHSMGARKEDVNTFPTYYAWRNWIRFFIKYTPDDKLENMIYSFLTSLFYVQYEGYLKQEYQRSSTVMSAYDDAIHNVTGKAKEGIIGNTDTNISYHEKLKNLKNSEDKFVYMVDSIFSQDTVDNVAELLSALSLEEAQNSFICDESDLYCSLLSYNDFLEKVRIAKEAFVFSQVPLFLEGIKNLRS